MSEKNDYFDYVANVLGVKSVLLNQDITTLLPVVPLLISIESFATYNSDEKDLLSKMIGALKIDLQLIKVVDLSQSSLFQPEYVIYFLDEPVDNAETNLSAKLIKTYSPRFLLKNPKYKKNVWEELQKVILYFNNSNQQT